MVLHYLLKFCITELLGISLFCSHKTPNICLLEFVVFAVLDFEMETY